ncbi:MAG: hypothetical protein CM1200mP33_5850 [Chloroflexota bacterium]|nr:MAG: hypothetical protein CM1200mP33_5850 [Chloroflexota bacterium]
MEVNDHGVFFRSDNIFPQVGEGSHQIRGKLILENNEYLKKGLKRIEGPNCTFNRRTQTRN